MADAFEQLLRDDVLAAGMGAAARRVAFEDHGRELMHARYENLFLSLARNA
jgi:hypothetical protein